MNNLKNPNPPPPPMNDKSQKIIKELFAMDIHQVKDFGTEMKGGYAYFEVMRVLTGWIYRTGQAQVFVPETRVVDLIG